MKPPLLEILINKIRFEVFVEQVCETAVDGRGGCLFRFKKNGKTAFIPFQSFTFVL